jgi:hypothetical protein
MNHAYASSKRSLTIPFLVEELKTILGVTFGDLLEVEPVGDYVIVRLASEPHWQMISVSLKTPRKIETRKGRYSHFAGYVEWVVTTYLAYRQHGRCSNDGVSGTWAPDPDLYPTYKAYWWGMSVPDGEPDILLKALFYPIWVSEKKLLPEAVRAYIDRQETK